jgi:hypothetical protein
MRTLLLSLLVLCACGSQPDVMDKNLDTATLAEASPLVGTWWHVHEEDADGVQVFRRDGTPLPPARGRTGFTVRQDGTFVYLDIAPADGTLPRPGRWTLEGSLLRATLEDGTVLSYQIDSFPQDQLRIRR